MIVHAQLLVTPADELGWSAEDLVRNIFLNSGVSVSNVKFNGSMDTIFCDNIGIFETGTTPTNLGMESGIIIATGKVNVAVGPNNSDNSFLATNCDTYYDKIILRAYLIITYSGREIPEILICILGSPPGTIYA